MNHNNKHHFVWKANFMQIYILVMSVKQQYFFTVNAEGKLIKLV